MGFGRHTPTGRGWCLSRELSAPLLRAPFLRRGRNPGPASVGPDNRVGGVHSDPQRSPMSHRTRRLSRRQQRLARVVSAARWQRRALRNADVPATRSLIDGDPETRQRLQTHFLGRERGAVLVEYAIILPLAVMLGVSGLFYG